VKYYWVLFLIPVFFLINDAYGEEIWITFSEQTNEIILDGIWTDRTEWKTSSEDVIIIDDDNRFAIRSAHDRNNIFLLIDFITDQKISNSDKMILCIGPANLDSEINVKEYCFTLKFNSNNLNIIELQKNEQKINYVEVKNELDVEAKSGVSNLHNRYSKIPHTSYELKIPVDKIGRDNVYNFYLKLYDADTNRYFTWPNNMEKDNSDIPLIEKWGKLVSPDKTIPEFGIPMTILMITITSIIISTKIFRNIRMI